MVIIYNDDLEPLKFFYNYRTRVHNSSDASPGEQLFSQETPTY